MIHSCKTQYNNFSAIYLQWIRLEESKQSLLVVVAVVEPLQSVLDLKRLEKKPTEKQWKSFICRTLCHRLMCVSVGINMWVISNKLD